MKSISIWKHEKTGGLYQILAHAKHEATLEQLVVYQNCATLEIWARPAKEFFDGRFVKVGEVNAKPLS